MKVVKNNELEWFFSEKHNMFGGVHADLPNNNFADVMFAKVISKHTLKLHYHKRKENEYESFFFFQGGNIKISDGVDYKIINSTDPFTITFFANEPHSITNLDDRDVIFQVITAPRFDENEEVFIE